ncbi:hypothetical protein JCM16303_007211 [Sporobolomyces ruberrimus]
MSFSYLPQELKEAVLIHLAPKALASVCLVSKATLHLARPFLYRSISCNRPTPESTEGVAPGPQRRANLDRTLKAHPEWCTYTRDFLLELNTCWQEDEDHALRLLAFFPNLNSLTILTQGFARPSTTACTILVADCPRSLSLLNLEHCRFPPFVILKLLENLPNLNSLTLGSKETSHWIPSSSSLVLNHLHVLKCLKYRPEHALFGAIATSTQSLTRLHINFVLVQDLEHVNLSQLLDLSIQGDLADVVFLDTSKGLVSILDRCTSLRSFKMFDSGSWHNEGSVYQLESQEILHHLPLSLQSLTLVSITFTHPYLSGFLSTTPIPLRYLELSRPDSFFHTGASPVCDTSAEEDIEEVCERRNIHLAWIDVGKEAA